MKPYNELSNPDDVCEHEVMAFFNCNKAMAKTIIQSSKMNGQFPNIKKLCHDNVLRKEKQ